MQTGSLRASGLPQYATACFTIYPFGIINVPNQLGGSYRNICGRQTDQYDTRKASKVKRLEMKLRQTLRKSHLARQLYFRTWVVRYLIARVSGRQSYAQGGEDVKINDLIGEVRWFVDIGAHDGVTGSNTLYFALRGARGICFEPVSETYIKLRWFYALNPRIRTVRCGISDRNGKTTIIAADFVSYLPETEDSAHTSLSTMLESSREMVMLLRFEDAIEGLELPDEVDLLSIDVEGHELRVLKSIDFKRRTFRAVVVETHLIDNAGCWQWRHRDLEEIESLLSTHNYQAVHRSLVNTIYLPVHRTRVHSIAQSE
jgi:FkbM family methyltransferase